MYETLSRVCGCLWCTHTTVPMVACLASAARAVLAHCTSTSTIRRAQAWVSGYQGRVGPVTFIHPPPGQIIAAPADPSRDGQPGLVNGGAHDGGT